MRFEEEFGCEIPDEAADSMFTVGDVTSYDNRIELPAGHAEVLLLSAARMPSASNLLKPNLNVAPAARAVCRRVHAPKQEETWRILVAIPTGGKQWSVLLA